MKLGPNQIVACPTCGGKGVLDGGFYVLLAIVTGRSACASWAEAGGRPVNGAAIERSIQ